mmetsp:Transcript_23079/g.47191  ORF Transcript_23079/g.47191 Transcript_23079/m.47191 type:complete len:337 (-) Transcript_23079:328-1338(-)
MADDGPWFELQRQLHRRVSVHVGEVLNRAFVGEPRALVIRVSGDGWRLHRAFVQPAAAVLGEIFAERGHGLQSNGSGLGLGGERCHTRGGVDVAELFVFGQHAHGHRPSLVVVLPLGVFFHPVLLLQRGDLVRRQRHGFVLSAHHRLLEFFVVLLLHLLQLGDAFFHLVHHGRELHIADVLLEVEVLGEVQQIVQLVQLQLLGSLLGLVLGERPHGFGRFAILGTLLGSSVQQNTCRSSPPAFLVLAGAPAVAVVASFRFRRRCRRDGMRRRRRRRRRRRILFLFPLGQRQLLGFKFNALRHGPHLCLPLHETMLGVILGLSLVFESFLRSGLSIL